MKTVRISINNIDKVKSFVNAISRFENDFDLVSEKYVVNAKSIMSIFTLDIREPIFLNFSPEDNTDKILTALSPYLV